MHRLILIALPLLLTAAPLPDGESQLAEGRTTLALSTLNQARQAFAACTRSAPEDANCYYQLAQSDFYLSKAETIAKQKDASRHSLDQAIEEAQKALTLNDKSAGAHALLGDLYGAKITGMMSGMHYGPKASAETEKALQLDPNNAQAYAVLGRKCLYSPAAFGGNIDKAIDSFKKATTLQPDPYEDFVWLAIAYRKKGNAELADKALDEALRLNPRSVFAQRTRAGILP